MSYEIFSMVFAKVHKLEIFKYKFYSLGSSICEKLCQGLPTMARISHKGKKKYSYFHISEMLSTGCQNITIYKSGKMADFDVHFLGECPH